MMQTLELTHTLELALALTLELGLKLALTFSRHSSAERLPSVKSSKFMD
jgi:hypothetical protein